MKAEPMRQSRSGGQPDSLHREGRRVTWVSLGVNLVIALIKTITGLLTFSQALVADGLHSLVDASTDLAVLLGLRFSKKPRDEGHPYGHHRISTLVQLLVSAMLILFSLGIALQSVHQLRMGSPTTPSAWALLAALLSLGCKEVLFWRTRSIALRLKSQLLMANAWHHRADSLSSLLVLIALAVIVIGGPQWTFLDKVLGFVLGSILLATAFRQFVRGLNDLTDRVPERRIIDDFREHVLPVEGALAYHDFRARRIGDVFEVDLHLQVHPQTTVLEGHRIAGEVKHQIMRRHPEVFQVMIHLEPANEEGLKNVGLNESLFDADAASPHDPNPS